MSSDEDSVMSDTPPSYRRDEIDMREVHQTVSRSVNDPSGENVLSRLSTVSQTLSHLRLSQMHTFKIDPEDFDLQRVLKFLCSRNNEHEMRQKKTSVFYEDLTVMGKNTSAAQARDLRSTVLPFLDWFNKKDTLDLSKMSKTREIIRGVTGYALPGTMTLVLGRPGAGCSTFLKSIGGEMQSYLGTTGELRFDGIPVDEMSRDFKNQLIYVPELDDHFPYLTVEQTLRFAIGCKTPALRAGELSRSDYITTVKDLYTVLFGLNNVEKTLVGNDYVRGISGGQRKRVSIAEAMATGGTVFCYDNATRGLDASTALEFVEALRTSTNVTHTTSFVTAYQASENIYQLFDYVTVLYLGKQVYFGPGCKAVDYFERMGFEKGSRQTSSEYLTAITDPLERKARPGFETRVPKNADEFEQYWRDSPEFNHTCSAIHEICADSNPDTTKDLFKDVHNAQRQKGTTSSSYTVNFLEQLMLCSTRGFYNIVNNKAYTVIQMGTVLFQGLVMGSLYYNCKQDTSGAFSRGGAVYFALLDFMVMALAEVSAVFENKPILSKQRGYTLYHPSAEYLSSQIVRFPVAVASSILFSIIFYFLAGLKASAGAFFIFLLFGILTVQGVQVMFTFVSSLCPTLSVATGVTGLLLLWFLLYSSFMIQLPSMYWWFRWFAYLNPLLYGFEAMVTTEFHNQMMACAPSQLIPRGEGYESVNVANQVCGFTGAAPTRQNFADSVSGVFGDIYVSTAFDYFHSHVWRNLGILLAIIFGLLAVNSLLAEYYNPVVATSDKLQFVRGAKVPENLLENSDGPTAATVPVTGHPDETISDSLGSGDIFSWKHVNYVVPYQGEDRKLLDDVQGYVLPGTLTALMGESGAGKTTLLNVLSQRVDVGVVTGDFLINGNPLDPSFSRRTGYVQQQDIHIAELTVRESLLFAARLRRPLSVPDSDKVEYVNKIMRILHMEEYADAIAGAPGYGLNVEQRKKLSIATELVAKPSLLLFLDEPTSGLDSQSSWAIVQVLKQLAAAGQAILCTIHQPSATLFEQFDRLLLLKRGGVTTYFGPIGTNSRTVIQYFESHGGRHCENDENSAEYILDVIGAGATATSSQDWADVWLRSEEYEKTAQEVDHLTDSTSTPSTIQVSKFATPYFYQLKLVLQRTWTQLYRDMDYMLAKLAMFVIGGLVDGFSFWDLKYTVIGNQMAVFANFMPIILTNPLTNQLQSRAIQSRELFEVRESKSSTFHWSALLLSQFLVEIPFLLVFATLYFVVFYFPIQLPLKASVAGFWWFNYCFIVQIYTISLALLIVYAAPNLPSAAIFSGMMFNLLIGFCGAIQPPSSMPGFWKFLWRASPYTYFLENMVGVFLHGREVRCSETELNYLDPPAGTTCGEYLSSFFESHSGYVSNPLATSNCGVCEYSVGDQYMATVEIYFSHRWRNVGLSFIYITVNLGLMLGLYYIVRVRKK